MRTLLLASLLLLGCGVKNAVDCHGICHRYQSCFDGSYDTDACERRCRDHADNDDQYANKVDHCASCIDDRSCASATFSCSGDCSGIVP
jgi:hypothetical protein